MTYNSVTERWLNELSGGCNTAFDNDPENQI